MAVGGRAGGGSAQGIICHGREKKKGRRVWGGWWGRQVVRQMEGKGEKCAQVARQKSMSHVKRQVQEKKKKVCKKRQVQAVHRCV